MPGIKAQDGNENEANGSFGIKGGLNLTTMSVDDVDENNVFPSFHVGFWGKVPISEKFAVQPEVLFSVKGMKAEYDEDFLGVPVVDGETTLKLSYIDVPVYFVYNLSEDFNFHLGPYVSFLLDANLDADNEILGFIDIDNEDDLDKDNFNKVDAGISAGLGFNLNNFLFGFNYNLGLTEVAKEDAAEALIGDAKNNVIQVYVGLAF